MVEAAIINSGYVALGRYVVNVPIILILERYRGWNIALPVHAVAT